MSEWATTLGGDRDGYLHEAVEVRIGPPRCSATALLPTPEIPVLSCVLHEGHEDAHLHPQLQPGKRLEWTEVDGEVLVTIHDDRPYHVDRLGRRL